MTKGWDYVRSQIGLAWLALAAGAVGTVWSGRSWAIVWIAGVGQMTYVFLYLRYFGGGGKAKR